MLDTMKLHQPQHALLVRTSKESFERHACTSEFPEYLKHADLLGESLSSLKLTTSNNLFHAVLKGRVRGTQYILDRGTAVNGRNDYGYSVLTAALHIDNRKRRDKMFRLLLDRGADPLFKDSTYGRTVLHWVCVLGRTEQAKTLLDEVAGDIDLNEKDKASYTALHHAVMAGHLPIVMVLVDIHRKFGVTVDVADQLGLTPYLHAKRLGYRDVADYLHREGLASQGHGDLLFRSPREWSQIGKFERQKAIEIHTKEAINIAKIRGKISQARSIQGDKMTSPRMAVPNIVLPSYSPAQNPGVKLAIRHSDRLSMSLPSLQEHPQGGPWLRPLSANGAGPDLVDSGAAQLPQGRLVARPPREAFVNAGDLGNNGSDHFQSSSRDPLVPGAAASVYSSEGNGHGLSLPSVQGPNGTATLSLMEMHNEGRHANTYRQSQFDETKASEYQHMLGNLNSIMDMLSQQQSKSFRQSVKYQKPETPPKKKKQKPKVSSLALIFGRGKGRHRKTSPVGRKKKEKGGGGEEKKAKATGKKKAVRVVKVNGK